MTEATRSFFCRKCKIYFTTEREGWRHQIQTGWYEQHPDPERIGGGTSWFHIVVDKDGNNILYQKEVLNR